MVQCMLVAYACIFSFATATHSFRPNIEIVSTPNAVYHNMGSTCVSILYACVIHLYEECCLHTAAQSWWFKIYSEAQSRGKLVVDPAKLVPTGLKTSMPKPPANRLLEAI